MITITRLLLRLSAESPIRAFNPERRLCASASFIAARRLWRFARTWTSRIIITSSRSDLIFYARTLRLWRHLTTGCFMRIILCDVYTEVRSSAFLRGGRMTARWKRSDHARRDYARFLKMGLVGLKRRVCIQIAFVHLAHNKFLRGKKDCIYHYKRSRQYTSYSILRDGSMVLLRLRRVDEVILMGC